MKMKISRGIRCALVFLLLAIITFTVSIFPGYNDICHPDESSPANIVIWDDAVVPVFAANMPKIIALTFDDGPHSVYTAQILDFLKQQDVKATFFVLGVKAKQNRKLIKRMRDEGHQIGSHGYDHESFTKLSNSALEKQIAKTDEIIKEITGKRPSMIRPPRGKVDSRVKSVIDRPLIFWSVDPKDWDTRDAQKVTSHVIKRAKAGDIILLHDIRKHTVKAVKAIIPALKKEGFAFVTVEDLLISAYGNIDGKVYRSAK